MDNDLQPTEYVAPDDLEIKSKLPYMGLNHGDLSVQEEKFIGLIASGMSIAAAGRAVGHSNRKQSTNLVHTDRISKALAYLREEIREEVKFTKVNAHKMYMDTWTACGNATEMKGTVDSLCKLHGLHQPDSATQVNININGTKQLERMTDEELLQLAGHDKDYLEPAGN
jgi:hypothetical protein